MFTYHSQIVKKLWLSFAQQRGDFRFFPPFANTPLASVTAHRCVIVGTAGFSSPSIYSSQPPKLSACCRIFIRKKRQLFLFTNFCSKKPCQNLGSDKAYMILAVFPVHLQTYPTLRTPITPRRSTWMSRVSGCRVSGSRVIGSRISGCSSSTSRVRGFKTSSPICLATSSGRV